jgi:hypothetical protein
MRSWAKTVDKSARTEPARRAADARFEKEADPDGVLTPEERARKADYLRRAAMAELSLRAAQARKRRQPKNS